MCEVRSLFFALFCQLLILFRHVFRSEYIFFKEKFGYIATFRYICNGKICAYDKVSTQNIIFGTHVIGNTRNVECRSQYRDQ